jgi:hypothetical protein
MSVGFAIPTSSGDSRIVSGAYGSWTLEGKISEDIHALLQWGSDGGAIGANTFFGFGQYEFSVRR